MGVIHPQVEARHVIKSIADQFSTYALLVSNRLNHVIQNVVGVIHSLSAEGTHCQRGKWNHLFWEDRQSLVKEI